MRAASYAQVHVSLCFRRVHAVTARAAARGSQTPIVPSPPQPVSLLEAATGGLISIPPRLALLAVTGLWTDSASSPTSFLVSLTMPDLQHTVYGAPSTLWLNVSVNFDGSVAMDLQMFNKTATRLGEAHFFHFLPTPQAGDYSWMMDK